MTSSSRDDLQNNLCDQLEQELRPIHVDEQLTDRIIAAVHRQKETQKKQSTWERWWERLRNMLDAEVVIPLPQLVAGCALVLAVVGVYFGQLYYLDQALVASYRPPQWVTVAYHG